MLISIQIIGQIKRSVKSTHIFVVHPGKNAALTLLYRSVIKISYSSHPAWDNFQRPCSKLNNLGCGKAV
jgi:hypothetical protein